MGSAGVGGGVGSNLVAGAAQPGLYVEDVFKQFYYKGDQETNRQFDVGWDMENEGGMVMVKSATSGESWPMSDTVRGNGQTIRSNTTDVQWYDGNRIKSFNTTGFVLGSDGAVNNSSNQYLALAFRKCPKFFDIVTYVGNGTAGREIPHNLDAVPGMIWVKKLDQGNEDWAVYHKSVGKEYAMTLNSDSNRDQQSIYWNDTAPTSTHFTVGGSNRVNSSGSSPNYIAYLFADNEEAFGDDGKQSIMKLDEYPGTSSNNLINCGWESQIQIYKNFITGSNEWCISSSTLGYSVPHTSGVATSPNSSDCTHLEPSSNAQNTQNRRLYQDPLGFKWNAEARSDCNSNGQTYMFMAIRSSTGKVSKPFKDVTGSDRGKMFWTVHKNGSNKDVPPGSYSTATYLQTLNPNGWQAEGGLIKNWATGSTNWQVHGKQTMQRILRTNETTSNLNDGSNNFRSTEGWAPNQSTNKLGYAWKQSRGFTSMYYNGSGSAQTINHALGVVPEMIWICNLNTNDWKPAYHMGFNNGVNPWMRTMALNQGNGGWEDVNYWNNTAPTETTFTVGTNGAMNAHAENFMALLFASMNGVSKCGYYTGNGNLLNSNPKEINLGFAPRLLIIKGNTDKDWNVFDSQRGLLPNEGTWDGRLRLNESGSQEENIDFVLPTSSGFKVSEHDQVGANNENYIYYAHR